MFAPPVFLALVLPFGQPPGAADDLPRNPTDDLGLYAEPDETDGAADLPDAPVEITGEVDGTFRAGFPVTFTLTGPEALSETGDPNPFTDYEFTGTFGTPAGDSPTGVIGQGGEAEIPGYFAADGDAADTGADAGDKWRVQFRPGGAGAVPYALTLKRGGTVVAAASGTLEIDHAPGRGPLPPEPGAFPTSPKFPPPGKHRDLRLAGPLVHVADRLWLAGDRRPFFKTGANSPENLLAYVDFDGTRALKSEALPGENVGAGLHRFEPHLGDWNEGDPTWGDGRGKALIGALNYSASAGVNSIYFLTFNVAGDGKDVWPHVSPDDRTRFDCSKLDQWERVFTHADSLGIALHVVLTETENESLFEHRDGSPSPVGGASFADTRKLYYRELIARFAHHPGVMWNLAEEIGFSDKPNEKVGDGRGVTVAQQRAFADYLKTTDPYEHPVTIHTFPNREGEIYTPLLGAYDVDGASLQMAPKKVRAQTLAWLARSRAAGNPWFACYDEQNPADTGVMPDGADGVEDNHRRVRRAVWANLFSGGSGSEFYFGYKQPHNDLTLEDFRSRAEAWRWAGVARGFAERVGLAQFRPALNLVDDEDVWVMTRDVWENSPIVGRSTQFGDEDFIKNPEASEPRRVYARWAAGGADPEFADAGAPPGVSRGIYPPGMLVYLPAGADPRIPNPRPARAGLGGGQTRRVRWFDPVAGGGWQTGLVAEVPSDAAVRLGDPPGGDRSRDWVALIGG